VTQTKKTSRRKPGRPRKYGQGRINATVRFTPERYAELRAEADQQGRSFSEQVEHIVERAISERKLIATIAATGAAAGAGTATATGVALHARTGTATAAGAAAANGERLDYSVEQMEKLRAMYAAELEKLKEAYAHQEERLAEIVEAAVARALAKPRWPPPRN
jgi:hypothetical protein